MGAYKTKESSIPARHRSELPSLSRRINSHLDHTELCRAPAEAPRPEPGDAELWSSDYLALSGHAAIVQAQIDVLQGGGDDLYMSAAYLSDTGSQHALEQRLARFLGAEDAVLCQSGWCANVGLIQAVADKDTPVYIDGDAHASLWEGARSADAPSYAFTHNDADELKALIEEHGPGLVVVEAIYHRDGSICPLRDFVSVSEHYGCQTMVDESHSIGVWGRNGQGLVALLELGDEVTYRSFSLSRALVTRVGMVTGPSDVMEFFRYESRPAIFSSAVLPHEVAGLRAALEVIQEEEWRRQLLKRNATYLRTRLQDLGYAVAPEGSQIISLFVGPERVAHAFCQALRRRGVFGELLRPPATPEERSVLRLLVNCALNDEQLANVISACAELQEEFATLRGLPEQPHDAAQQSKHRPVRAARLPSLERRVARYFERVKDGHPLRGGTPGAESIELWSNDYLSLDGHRAIVEAQVEALRSAPRDLCLPANQRPEDGEHRRAERRMAEFLGTEDTVLCQSGWCANAGLLQTIADPDTPVYIDLYAHASLWEGAHLAGAQTKPFRHNTPECLEDMIKRNGPGIVVVDSIYSANGNICPLREVADIAARYDCALVVDESHAVGSYGARGEGLVRLLGLNDKVHYRTVSLSKAFVTRAGLVAGPARVTQLFRQQSPAALFSSSILGHEVARLIATLEVVQNEAWRRDILRRHTEYLRFHLNKLGYEVEASGSQVIALPAGEERHAIALRNALEAYGIFGAVFCFPATPKNGSLIRLSVNCGLSREDLDRVVQACTEIRQKTAS